MLNRLMLIVLFVLFPNLVFAEIKIIEFQHRLATDVVADIQTVLGPEEKVSAVGNLLILQADGESLAAAEKLAGLLDKQPQQLIVRTRQQLQASQQGSHNQGFVTLGTGGGAIQYQGQRYLGTGSQQTEQFLRLQEGSSGWIEIGRDIPYTDEWAVFNGSEGQGYFESTAYQRITTGFFVSPLQVLGEQVLVAISPQMMAAEQAGFRQAPDIRFSRYQSKAYLPFGEWVELGSQLQGDSRFGQMILSRRYGNSQEQRQVFIRIDRAEGFSP